MTIPTFIVSDNFPHHQLNTLYKQEYGEVRFVCDLIDTAWWKRPTLIATRNGDILPKFNKRMLLEKRDGSSILIIRRLQSNDTGIYECETMGAIKQYNLTVTGNL
ncbi:unnamed protein product [Didymodactylos carnosus]|uniref:Ig-like domain-containing protein n=1 Tax=Didymodactylos carnosus TaxID=1234261 RepID=A0A813R0S6_9BILA|nr:unnamed protein product [Didymodactylos carnosus]CAF0847093.1 unnamed protein product [Didymodactylos carnosus]CAF3559308.1 unnamed protein product [Didymodactylos carnosus]CAF3632327.1 unnamed protein product [Didymodactylos carnosus]